MGSKWTVTEQWKDNEEEVLTDWTQVVFNNTINNTGLGSVKLEDTPRAIDIMESAWLRIYYDGICKFYGKINKKNFSSRSVTIKLNDWMGLLANIPMSYCAADWDTGPVGGPPARPGYPRWDEAGAGDPQFTNYITKEVSVYLKRLLDIYTGETDSDSDIDYSNMDVTGLDDSFNHPKSNLGTVIWELYQGARVGSSSRFGYGTWMDYSDPDTPKLWAKPYGAQRYGKKLYFKGQPSFSWDPSGIVNDVTLVGGYGWPMPKYRDLISNYDASNWGDIDCAITNSTNRSVGSDSLLVTPDFEVGDIHFSRRIYGEVLNPLGNPTYVGGSYNVDHVSFDFQNDFIGTGVAFTLRVGQDTTDGTPGFPYQTGGLGKEELDMRGGGGHFAHFSYWDWEKGGVLGTPVYADPWYLYFEASASSGYLTGVGYFDNIRVFTRRVEANSQDTASIQKEGHLPKYFEAPQIRSWGYAQEICDSIVSQMANSTIKVKGTLQYYDPDLSLNMAVEVPVYGVTWPLYVSQLAVTTDGRKNHTIITAGSVQATVKELLKSMRMKEITMEAAMDVSGGSSTSSFKSDLCFREDETHCKYACMLSSCQNGAQRATLCSGVTDKDPCINTCQRYSQYKERCTTCQTISYGGVIV